jgi:hypothetical protein
MSIVLAGYRPWSHSLWRIRRKRVAPATIRPAKQNGSLIGPRSVSWEVEPLPAYFIAGSSEPVSNSKVLESFRPTVWLSSSASSRYL